MNFDNSIKEFRLCNPPPVLAAPLYASLQGYSHDYLFYYLLRQFYDVIIIILMHFSF